MFGRPGSAGPFGAVTLPARRDWSADEAHVSSTPRTVRWRGQSASGLGGTYQRGACELTVDASSGSGRLLRRGPVTVFA